MLIFIHIPKTAGTSLIAALRSRYGVRHVDLLCRQSGSGLACESDLRFANRLFRPKSIASHQLRPWQDFLADEAGMFTVLREPIDRYLSSFEHVQQRYEPSLHFEEWLRIEGYRNQQTKHIAGIDDASAAIELCHHRLAMTITTEHVPSLIKRLMPDNPRLERKNESSVHSDVRNELRARYADDLAEANAQDIALYRAFRAAEVELDGITLPLPPIWHGGGSRANLTIRRGLYKPLRGINPMRAVKDAEGWQSVRSS